MNFSYHGPTRTTCHVCERLEKEKEVRPIIDTINGKASSANGFPFHSWYNFVLGYTPSFPEYMLKKERIKQTDLVVDPFVGSGTTQLVCKLNSIPSIGIDANDFMIYAANQKLNWNVNITHYKEVKEKLIIKIKEDIKTINFDNIKTVEKLADLCRPIYLDERYISNKPLVKIDIIKKNIQKLCGNTDLYDIFSFALSSILVSISNVSYGPGFGIKRPKDDADVLEEYVKKLNIIEKDLLSVNEKQKNTLSKSILGDSRKITSYLKENTVSLMITSPPYPGDHEYTKHSKIELVFNSMAGDINSFRTIKKRMIVSSTTNIYKENNAKILVEDIESIKDIANEIQNRLDEDKATSGYEKLYTRLVWEYFGCMKQVLEECYKVLKKGGKIALLVSDSHSFKMVHIQTAEILREIGEKIGYEKSEIILWQLKNSTSHKYKLRENILILEK